MTEHTEALVNPEMIIWARNKSGLDLLGAAKRIAVKPERLENWEKGESYPTIVQAMKMAEVYHRPLSVFYLNEPPKDFSVAIRDYRHLGENTAIGASPGLIWEKMQAEIRRNIMRELCESEDDGLFVYPHSISLDDNPEKVAEKARSLLSIDWRTQKSWRNVNEALNGWKEAIEFLNILVFLTSHQGITFDPEEARGFSINMSHFPIIVINSKDSGGARVFTLLHEFIHLLLNAGGICDCKEYTRAESMEQRVEMFCNRVAGAILVPTSLLTAHDLVRDHGYHIDWDDEEIYKLSSEFSTSEDVILRRLLILGLTSREFYEYKHKEYIQRWHDFKEKRRAEAREGKGYSPPYYRLKLRANGKLYTKQVLSAYYDKQITLLDVSDFLGVKIRHIKDIEGEAFTSSIGA